MFSRAVVQKGYGSRPSKLGTYFITGRFPRLVTAPTIPVRKPRVVFRAVVFSLSTYSMDPAKKISKHNMPGSRKKVRANATSPSSRLKTIPEELLNVVLSHASPTSTRRISEVNKSMRSVTKNRLGLRASVGDTVYFKPYRNWGMEFYKRGNNGELKPLQKHLGSGLPFTYYNKGRFFTPIHPGNKRAALKNLGLKKLPRENNISESGHRYHAFRVLTEAEIKALEQDPPPYWPPLNKR